MKKQLITIIIGIASTTTASAGTLNVDFQSTTSGITMAEPGLIGTGSSWNTYFDSGLTSPLHDDGTQFTNPVFVVVANGGSIGGDSSLPAATTNPVHRDGINNSSGSLQIFITNLRPEIPLRLIVYLNSGNPPFDLRVTMAETGESKVADPRTRPDDIQDSVEGADYLVFEGILTNDSGVLEFTVVNETNPNSFSRITGLQIQGWLPGEGYPSKTDLLISKEKRSRYTGNDVYSGRQLQKVTGRRRGKFYFRLQNDADVWANYGLTAKGTDTDAVRKWFDLSKGRSNITAELVTGSYATGIDPGRRILLQGILRARPGTRKAVSILRGYAVEDSSPAYADRNKAIVKP